MIKQLIGLGILLMTLGCTSQPQEVVQQPAHQAEHDQAKHDQGGHQHAQRSQVGSELIVTTDPDAPVAGHPITLKLMIHAADGAMVKDFEVIHDEKVHLIIVRDGLDHFAHIHPTVDEVGNLTITHTFPVGGKYQLFADYLPAGGGPLTATATLSVAGDSPPAPALVVNAPGEVTADGVHVTIAAAPLKVGESTHVSFTIRDEAGDPAILERYMGALGHLMFVNSAAEYVHVHPLTGDEGQGIVKFEAHFAEPGLYKGWGRFKQSGQVRVIPFALRVE